MKKCPNRKSVFLMNRNGMRTALNRPARREQQALARKWYDGETKAERPIRQAKAKDWRDARYSRLMNIMRVAHGSQ